MADDKQTILVVDDTPENIDRLVATLKDSYNVKAATNGATALKLVRKAPPDLILLDLVMPEMDGYEVCEAIKADHTTRHIPIIFVTSEVGVTSELKGLELGAVDYITRPISPPIVKARVKTQLALYDQNRELDRRVRTKTQQLYETRLSIIQKLARAVEVRDNETGKHVIRMSQYSRALGVAAGMNESEAELLMHAAPMHDIGKIGIPDNVLQKPGKLTDEEFDIIKTHCVMGAEILGDDPSDLLNLAKIIALTHHEKWNGKGYPNGLAGENIPRVGRIVSIADVFDAVTSERPYKDAWPTERAIDMIQTDAGSHFDPDLVPMFVGILPEILEIKERYKD